MARINSEATKERLKVDLEKLKVISTIVVLITGGLIGLLFKDTGIEIRVILFGGGALIDFIFMVYLWKLNTSIRNLLTLLEGENV